MKFVRDREEFQSKLLVDQDFLLCLKVFIPYFLHLRQSPLRSALICNLGRLDAIPSSL